jgi:hypothetical protein
MKAILSAFFTTLRLLKSLQYSASKGLDGRVVMQRPAKPCTPVRFRLQPPRLIVMQKILFFLFKKKTYNSSNHILKDA